MSFSPDERETTVVSTDASDTVVIWSAQRRHITKMRKNPAFVEVRNGEYEGSVWAEFHIPAELWSPVGVKRKRNLTQEERSQLRERFLKQMGRE